MIRLGKRLAARSTHSVYHHSAVVVRGGAVVGVGFNTASAHAEVAAIRNIWPDKRRGCKIWSMRYTTTGTLANARPCPACQRVLAEAGIRVCFYSDANGEIRRLKLR